MDKKTFDTHPASIVAMIIVFFGPAVLLAFTFQPLAIATALYINVMALSFFDFREFRLPNSLNAMFFLLATIISYYHGVYAFSHYAIGAIAGFTVPLLINAAYKYVRGRDGIGMGDIKLLAGAGMLLGWSELPLILSISSTLGLGYAIARFGRKKVNAAVIHIPFGPFIGFATLILWLFNSSFG